MTKRSLLVGNWKLNHLMPKAESVVQAILAGIESSSLTEVAIAPVATQLAKLSELSQNTQLKICAQNVFYQTSGAFTGEWSTEHLSEAGVSMAIVGHSERRQYFAEKSDLVALKAKACLENNLTPIICIGESLAERESGETEKVLSTQLEPVLAKLSKEDLAKSVVAYEPIWAIGTGKTASIRQVSEVHAFLAAKLGDKTRLLYGGSVKPSNAAELFDIKDVDGFLVGGASLEAESFLSIFKAMLPKG